MKKISDKESKKLAEELAEWLGEKIGTLKTFLLFADANDEGYILHSGRMDAGQMMDANAWLSYEIVEWKNKGIKYAKPK